MRSHIIGLGAHVPDRVVDNEEIAFIDASLDRQQQQQIDTNHDWIVERTGIHQRRFAAPGVATSDLAAEAARRALADAGVSADQVDGIVLATLSPDIFFPGTGVFVQQKLGMTHNPACYDIRQQCSGFIYGLEMADALIASGRYRKMLLIGAEVQSHGMDFSTRGRDMTVLFGDGAGAVVLQAAPEAGPHDGVVYTKVAADGSGAQLLKMDLLDIASAPLITYDPADREQNRPMYASMDGRKVFIHAVKRMSEACLEALASSGLGWDAIDWFVPHQANMRISQQVADKIGVPQDKVLHSIDRYGNTTAATIPLTLALHRDEGRLQPGDRVLSAAFGSGFTWGAAIYTVGSR